MAKDFSFDVVSDFDIQEMNNAIDQTKREILTRYDFKGTNPEIEYIEDKTGLILNVDTEYKLTALLDILESKMVKRNLSLKILDKTSPAESASDGRIRKKVVFRRGMTQDEAKEITKKIREHFPKAKTVLQGEQIRVSSTSKDELQAIINLLREANLAMPIQFTNFK